MSETKFTPGPWEVINGGDIFGPLGGDSGDGLRAETNDGWQVAEVRQYPAFTDEGLVDMGKGVTKANAHLIAAAPELYEALEVFGRLADQLDGDDEVERTPDDEWAKFRLLAADYMKARAALAKARGES
ncbi:hypothetical protein KUV74_12325 [Halomonas sp. DP1Y21-3]|uniref:hypothetical protein n=1 Tax=Halomonas sp. DP1Y21-3 TaxID=2859080 RepID=UPI001C978FE2|nr:hypothetical protein [Halomonas sp. DP1Y21-3]MBY6111179.1 hypothetical protein [Halomonas sp. DP1Y21-3]